jgi:hypothetical protein
VGAFITSALLSNPEFTFVAYRPDSSNVRIGILAKTDFGIRFMFSSTNISTALTPFTTYLATPTQANFDALVSAIKSFVTS